MSSDLVFTGGAYRSLLELKVSPRARSMRLKVDSRTGQVLLTMPRRTSPKRAREWAESKRGWVEAALAKIPQAVPIAPGATIPFRGIEHVIDWRESAPRRVERSDNRIITGGPVEAVEGRVLRWMKQQALQVLEEETRFFAVKAGVTVSRVGVGDPMSRWGSCSSSGGIRYSWRLILAPDFVRTATVAHEVAHRVHMNHGREFHALVAELLGSNPKPANDWLRRHGGALHRVGRGAA